tara:strand:+ start:464 stop:1009 length:546 start_codon:yes stop_codon:yes gene_type:complete
MRLLPIIFLLAACQPTEHALLQTADSYHGFNEVQHRNVLKKYVGVDPKYTEWCAAFVNAVLEEHNVPGSMSTSDYPLMARSFLSWGEPVDARNIRPGDIVVFPRGNTGWKGHVGFYVKTTTNGNWIILGGNQDNSVSYSAYDPKRALGIRRYKYSYEDSRSFIGETGRAGLGVLAPTRTNR